MRPNNKSSAPPSTEPLPGQGKRVCVARIGAAHGIRGEVRLQSFTTDPLAVADYGPLQTADGQSFEIVSLRPQKDSLVARLKGVDDRTAAERLRNAELYVARARLPEPAADEFLHADLVGLRADDAAGAALGSVVAVHNFGAGDLLEIAPVGGGATVMLPFTMTVVPVVDIAAGRIVVDPPEGTFELSPEPSPLEGEGGETRAERGSSRVRGPQDEPLTRSSPASPARTTLSRKARG